MEDSKGLEQHNEILEKNINKETLELKNKESESTINNLNNEDKDWENYDNEW